MIHKASLKGEVISCMRCTKGVAKGKKKKGPALMQSLFSASDLREIMSPPKTHLFWSFAFYPMEVTTLQALSHLLFEAENLFGASKQV